MKTERRAIRILPLLVAVALSGCDSPFGSLRVGSIRISGPAGPMLVGSRSQLTAETLDPGGQVIAVEVNWFSSDPEVASVDPQGVVQGLMPGEATVWASARGVESERLRIDVRSSMVDLGVDSLVLGGWGCTADLFAETHPTVNYVSYTVADPSILLFFTIRTTATTRGLRAGLFALNAGTTEVVATHPQGGADTVAIRVSDAQESASLAVLDYGLMEVDFDHPSLLQYHGPCGAVSQYEIDQLWGGAKPPRAEVLSLSPEIVSVDTMDSAVTLTAHQFGSGLIETRFGSAVTTTPVFAMETAILPRDTTITLGDSVAYAVLLTDSTGALAPQDEPTIWTERDPSEHLEDGVYVGQEVGVDTIRAFVRTTVVGPSYLWLSPQSAIVRVVR
jgi:hypothetical protein